MNPNPTPGQNRMAAGVGRRMVIELDTSEGLERLELEIVPDEYADFDRGFLGESTPLAKAIRGLRAGQSVPYRLGDARSVRVVQVEPARQPPPKENVERRQESLRKALDQADRTNAMIFASSFSGKWGDYDPTGFIDEQRGDEDNAGETGSSQKTPG
jgi:hypothetical protein